MEENSSCEPGPFIPRETLQTDAILTVQDLSFAIDKKTILKDINFEIQKEGIVAVLGANGSGKSTLLRLLAGFLEPSKGKIFFEQEKVLGPDHQLVAGHEGIALVRQDNRLFPLHTVKENLNHILRDEDEEYKTERIAQLSELLGLTPNLNRILKFMSGGEQQRVAIAAALAANPKVLLMDEPFSQTDMYLKQELKKYLVDIVEQLGILLMFVTHEPEDAMALSDHVLVIHQGELIEQGSPKEVYYHPKHISTARLTGVCNLIPLNPAIQKLGFPKFEEGCLVRPDQIVIRKSQVPHSLLSTVEKIEFCGFFQNIHMLLEESQSEIIAVQMTNLTDLSVGDKVWAEFKS